MRIATMLLAVVVVLVAAPAWAADLQAGADAYAQGDYATALKEWRPVAEQGEATAQGLLGAMYLGGGYAAVPKDYVQAHMWFNLAGAEGHEDYRKQRDAVAELMTPAQLDDAQRLAREWKAKGK